MSFISKRCEYGLRAAFHIAAHQKKDDFLSIRDISEELDISFHFLTKILQSLTRAGIMTSSRGRTGGIVLAKPASEITLYEILHALGETDPFHSCILGLAACGDQSPCPLHAAWAVERIRLKSLFENMTLDQLADPIARGEIRLRLNPSPTPSRPRSTPAAKLRAGSP
ncbi:MAG TPA: Rrf2 family transcriptional regulator [Kiritimatiellia bacterium]|nr:Rrf2 family transcriptional regulator [Kiritimatiellia bacterium]